MTDKYVFQNWSQTDLAGYYAADKSTVRGYLDLFNIPVREAKGVDGIHLLYKRFFTSQVFGSHGQTHLSDTLVGSAGQCNCCRASFRSFRQPKKAAANVTKVQPAKRAKGTKGLVPLNVQAAITRLLTRAAKLSRTP